MDSFIGCWGTREEEKEEATARKSKTNETWQNWNWSSASDGRKNAFGVSVKSQSIQQPNNIRQQLQWDKFWSENKEN